MTFPMFRKTMCIGLDGLEECSQWALPRVSSLPKMSGKFERLKNYWGSPSLVPQEVELLPLPQFLVLPFVVGNLKVMAPKNRDDSNRSGQDDIKIDQIRGDLSDRILLLNQPLAKFHWGGHPLTNFRIQHFDEDREGHGKVDVPLGDVKF